MSALKYNYYYLVTIFTATYSFAFIYFLAKRFEFSKVSRRFAVFLMAVFGWSVKDSVSVMVLRCCPGIFNESLAALSLFILVLPLCLFVMLTGIYNAVPGPQKQFRHEKMVFIALAAALGIIYLVTLIHPSFLYRAIVPDQYGYSYAEGPGLIFLLAIILIVLAIPGLRLVMLSL
ncbi:MAG: hypothetical protein PHC61_08945, partial [Chitinivibrionales bacterium]|nr:hypothetical protein [Chitinivibrionales bacterium]